MVFFLKSRGATAPLVRELRPCSFNKETRESRQQLRFSVSLSSCSPPLSFFLSTGPTLKTFYWWLILPPI